MPVRRLRAAKPTAPTKVARARVTRPVVRAAATYELPTERTWPSEDIREYSLLLYGPPGIGKTTFFASFPEALFLLTEPGKPSGAFVFNESGGGITDWKVMRAAVELLEKDKSQFKNVVIDTLDEAYRLAMQYVCKGAGIKHPSEKKDFGKTWGDIADAILDVTHRIQRTGRGIYLTSHASHSTVELAGGGSYSKIGPNITGKGGERIKAAMDFIFFADCYSVDGQTTRLIRTSLTELITAKARPIGRNAIQLPTYIPLPNDPREDYNVFAAAFRGEDVGIDPTRVHANVLTSKGAADQMKVEQKAKVQRAESRALAAKKKGG